MSRVFFALTLQPKRQLPQYVQAPCGRPLCGCGLSSWVYTAIGTRSVSYPAFVEASTNASVRRGRESRPTGGTSGADPSMASATS